jgi:3',5'-nucleoside bisphosphate phosphatase
MIENRCILLSQDQPSITTMLITSDLHGHTLFSDGRHTPEEYVEQRRAAGMLVVALSDHDVLTGVVRGAAAAARARMWFLPAVEVTAFLHHGTQRAEQFHILAYYPPTFSTPPLLRATSMYQRGVRVQERWRSFVLTWMDGLGAEDRDAVDPDGGLSRLPPAEFPALQPMFDLLMRRRRSVFQAFFDHNRRFWEDDPELFGWQPEEAIEAIRADGAVDVIAHPARYEDQERTRAVAGYATGLELHTSREEAAPGYRELADEGRKLWTASSDDHQYRAYQKPLRNTPVRTLERLLRRTLPIEMICS